MSGWSETQAQARRRRLFIVASAAVAASAAALIWRFGVEESPRLSPKVADEGPCIALAIDRDTGIAVAEPCSGARVLLAEQVPSR
ncbi:MAG: hypothetical protein EKK41_23065 [Hyphomicrobiales bacterium]|nr:MAG: hypothetical protein EKK41_23065 [Hyphomicrobiales bacterium]